MVFPKNFDFNLIFSSFNFILKVPITLPKSFFTNFVEPKNFKTNTQHDSLEFFDAILDSLRYECEVMNKSEIFEKYFGFELEHRISCQNCSYSSSEKRNHFALILNITDVTCQLNGLLENYFEEKYISDFKCICGNSGIHEIICLRNLPMFFNIKISRFTNHLTKIMTLLKYQEDIVIMNTPYALSGVLIHQGSSIQCGHYYSYVKLESRWFIVNDSAIEETTFEELVEFKETTCMLVYEQKIIKY